MSQFEAIPDVPVFGTEEGTEGATCSLLRRQREAITLATAWAATFKRVTGADNLRVEYSNMNADGRVGSQMRTYHRDGWFGSNWVRLAPNGTNPGLFQIIFQCIWRRGQSDLKKTRICPIWGPIWPTLDPNLPSLLAGRRMTSRHRT